MSTSASVFEISGSAPSIANDNGSFVTIADAQFLFHADFKRTGSDLTLTGNDGHRVVVPEYFKHDRLPTLLAPDGAALTGDVVAALAGPRAPGQYAQVGGAQVPSDVPLIGRVATVSGSATAVRNGVAVALNVGDAIYKGDVVQTQSDSTVGLIFGDGTTFNLSADARMTLNEFVYNPAPGSVNAALINLVQGSFTFLAGEVAKTGDMKVGTPSTVIGIRGTLVQGDVDVVLGHTKWAVVVERDGTVGSFQVFSLSGQLLATVNNPNIQIVATPTAALQATVIQLQRTQADLAQAAVFGQQVSQTQAVGRAIIAAQPIPPSPPAGTAPNAPAAPATPNAPSGPTTPQTDPGTPPP